MRADIFIDGINEIAAEIRSAAAVGDGRKRIAVDDAVEQLLHCRSRFESGILIVGVRQECHILTDAAVVEQKAVVKRLRTAVAAQVGGVGV